MKKYSFQIHLRYLRSTAVSFMVHLLHFDIEGTRYPALGEKKNILFFLILTIKLFFFCILKPFIQVIRVYTMWETAQASKEASHTGSADRGVI